MYYRIFLFQWFFWQTSIMKKGIGVVSLPGTLISPTWNCRRAHPLRQRLVTDRTQPNGDGQWAQPPPHPHGTSYLSSPLSILGWSLTCTIGTTLFSPTPFLSFCSLTTILPFKKVTITWPPLPCWGSSNFVQDKHTNGVSDLYLPTIGAQITLLAPAL